MSEPMWITEADLEAKYGAEEVRRLADVDGDGVPDAGVVVEAIVDVEGRVTSRLLTRYRPNELPGPGVATKALRRVVRDLAFFELHKGYDQINPNVLEIRKDAEAELTDLVTGRASLVLPGSPPSDSTRAVILTSPSRPVADRLTLENFD